ncbi:ribonuclease HII [Salinarchaeum sp. Harcht-Bsk1]|uniref:ribonuclease HII n=1 Tax=Salinarchaeum sp. Harcht-Bsk1 TaxID=1333523 RepID=UPI0003423A50|nr:ribonuclease HII [Salinarchaeum sp. Harcht-Bsk1]AGN01445.1 ribonuclease HII [Salinarchaeum sp. Harcht-Bsk1]
MHVGIDEAGKGPVLGPMVCAAVGVADRSVLPDGVADSKRLSPDRREALDAELRDDDRVAVGVAAIDVERIDDPETDMNRLTVAGQAEAAVGLLGDAPDSTAECAVLADAGDTSETRFARRLADAVDERYSGDLDRSVDARHGADDDDPVVAAASIVAKVERDARVAEIAAEYGDVGSGYPSDPTTREFLEAFVREQGALPGCARTSWQTCDDVLADVEQASLGEY